MAKSCGHKKSAKNAISLGFVSPEASGVRRKKEVVADGL